MDCQMEISHFKSKCVSHLRFYIELLDVPLPLVGPRNHRSSGRAVHLSQGVGAVSETLPETDTKATNVKTITNSCGSHSYSSVVPTCTIFSLLLLLPLSEGQERVGGTEGWAAFTKSRKKNRIYNNRLSNTIDDLSIQRKGKYFNKQQTK